MGSSSIFCACEIYGWPTRLPKYMAGPQDYRNIWLAHKTIYRIGPNFRGAQFLRDWRFSKILWKFFWQTKDSISINTVFYNFAELNFRGSMPIRKKRENYAP